MGHFDNPASEKCSATDGDDSDDSEWKAIDTTAFRGKTTGAALVSRNDTYQQEGAREPLSDETLSLKGEGKYQKEWSTALSRGGRGLLFTNTTPCRWVDYCNGSSSSGSPSMSSYTSSSSEDMRYSPPGFPSGGVYGCAPGYDGGGRNRPVAADGQRSHSITKDSSNSRLSLNRQENNPTFSIRQARRLPLSVFRGGLADTPPQQQDEPCNYHLTSSGDSASTLRTFAWCILVHGCLCEAPLAVAEGLVRGPLYLIAAVWVAIVSAVGAYRHAEYRAELWKHAAALAREGVLLLVAAMTLAVPFSTSFTVYGNLVDHANDDTWDAGTVPTFLGAVDPLRFFVFAFGQAGEFAANGRLEPLNPIGNSQHPRWGPASSSPPFHFAGGGGGHVGLRVSIAAEDGVPDNGADGMCGGEGGPTPLISPVGSCVGVIAAQSMDTDRLGVGILHPPQEIGLRFRRAGANVRRGAVSTYRRMVTSAKTAYRRLKNAT